MTTDETETLLKNLCDAVGVEPPGDLELPASMMGEILSTLLVVAGALADRSDPTPEIIEDV
jgi:hypothetical protein